MARASKAAEDRVKQLKDLLGITGDEQDALLKYVMEAVEARVLHYINHAKLPPSLEKTLLLICVAYYKGAGLGSMDTVRGAVASVKRGDVTTSFTTSPGASQTFNLGDSDGDFFGWRTTLNEYRKLRW